MLRNLPIRLRDLRYQHVNVCTRHKQILIKIRSKYLRKGIRYSIGERVARTFLWISIAIRHLSGRLSSRSASHLRTLDGSLTSYIMLLALLGNIRTRWASLLLRLAEYFARTRCILSGLSNLCKAGPIDFLGPVDTLAPIDILESRDKQRDDFIEMIKKRERDIISLASYHNEGKSCKQFQEPEAGSFNICFFIQYIPDGEKRVLRFPLLPVLHNPHDMLLSEVTTME